jgi:hypothetical protein
MKKLLFLLMGVAATMNAMAVTYTAKATLLLESNTSHLTCEIDLLQSDAYGVLDGYDMYMEGRKVALYPICGDRQLQIAQAADLENVKLGLKTDASTSYKITVSGVEGETLVLWDLVAGEQHNLTEGKVINFTADANATNEERFVINYVPAPAYGSYERIVTNGNYGTICLPKNGEMSGATLFNIVDFDGSMIVIEEVGSNEMVAGKPYIFQASAEQIYVAYTDDNEVAASEANGLHGFYNLSDAAATFDVPADAGNYILNSNQYWLVVSTRSAYLNNYFAYIVVSEINSIAPAPGRRRVALAVNGAQVVTGIDELNATEAPVKTVIDGKMYIIRGEHMFDATGRMVK